MVRSIFRKCSLCRTRTFRLWTTMFKCKECKLLCHKKCFSKLMNGNTDKTPVTADHHLQQTEPLQLQSETPPSVEPIDGYVIAIFLQQRLMIRIDYSELVARIRDAKYVQRPYPLVNCSEHNYILWGQEIHWVTKFEMDDGDEYYVITMCYFPVSGCFHNDNQYVGQTIFIYSPSPLHETVRVLNRLWGRSHLVRIQGVDDLSVLI